MKVVNINSYYLEAIEYMDSVRLGQFMKMLFSIAQSPFSYYIHYNPSKIKRILNTDRNIDGVIKYFIDNKLMYKIDNKLTIPLLIVNELNIIKNSKVKNTIPKEFLELIKELKYDQKTLLPELTDYIPEEQPELEDKKTEPEPQAQALPPSRAINIEDFGKSEVERTCENCFSCKKLDNGTMRCTYDLHKKAVFAGETCRDYTPILEELRKINN